MKNVFVETGNVRRYLGALSALNERGAQESCLIVVDGEPGLGKTTTLRHWVAQTDSIYLRANKEWTASWFMDDLLDAIRVQPPRAFKEKFKRAISELALRHQGSAVDNGGFSIVIDEADHISSKQSILETVRDLTDSIEVPTILVGMGKINDNLKRFPQVLTRVSQRVRFEPATIEDVRLLIRARCEVAVADDLAQFVLKASRGFNREILEAIASIERFGLRADYGDEGVTLRDMAGQTLMIDRLSGKMIIVPGI